MGMTTTEEVIDIGRVESVPAKEETNDLAASIQSAQIMDVDSHDVDSKEPGSTLVDKAYECADKDMERFNGILSDVGLSQWGTFDPADKDVAEYLQMAVDKFNN